MRRIHRLRILPGVLSGELRVPGDKSLSHRCLILGAMSDGATSVRGLAESEDVRATARALRGLGITIDEAAEDEVLVHGALREATDVIDCGNSGTTMRLLTGVVAGIDGLTVLTGDDSLRRRPMGRIASPLRAMGARVDGRAGGTLAPLVVRGGELRAIEHVSPVASAQVKSAVLLAALAAEGSTTVTSPLRSRDHTERLLQHLGVDVESHVEDDGVERVALVGPAAPEAGSLEVPGDPSSAAFWAVAAALNPQEGTTVRLRDVGVNPTRTGFIDVLRSMGVSVDLGGADDRSGEPVADLEVASGGLGDGAELAGRRTVDALDEIPVLAVAGAVSRGGLDVRDAAELRVKESDRIEAVAGMLAALGVTCETGADRLRVPGGQRFHGGAIDAGGDHRIAMSAAVAATVADGPVEITGFGSVSSSYPTFLEDLTRLGGSYEVLEAEEAAR